MPKNTIKLKYFKTSPPKNANINKLTNVVEDVSKVLLKVIVKAVFSVSDVIFPPCFEINSLILS